MEKLLEKKIVRRVVSMEDARQMLGISRSLMYRLAAEGQIKVIRLGKRVLVTTEELERILEGQNR